MFHVVRDGLERDLAEKRARRLFGLGPEVGMSGKQSVENGTGFTSFERSRTELAFGDRGIDASPVSSGSSRAVHRLDRLAPVFQGLDLVSDVVQSFRHGACHGCRRGPLAATHASGL